MHCTSCGAPVLAGASRCPACNTPVEAQAPSVATGALTPPDAAPPAGGLGTDELASRLQAAVGPGYVVERALGAGGFAVVYLVRDLQLKRKLAVKVLSPDLVVSRTVLDRFQREAETVAQLHHPNIVPLHFIGQKDDLVYLAMQCVEGESLAARLEREGRLSAEETVRILREVASALEHAHRRGVIHRDIKPHNVLLEAESGRALVTDFGIARTAEGTSLTASGMVVGTPVYLSPEQVTGAQIDHRADLYALGVMAYEMLAGHPPFTGPTPTAVLMKRLAGPPEPLEKSRPDISQALRDVVAVCLAQDPAERFANAADVVRALGGATPVSGGHATTEIIQGMRRARRIWMSGATGAAVLAVGAVLWFLVPRPDGPPAGGLAALRAGTIVVPAGAYTIGHDGGHPFSRPAHSVRLDSFAIETHEVTVGEYRAFIAATRAPVPWRTEPDSTLPVTGVTWAEATAYCGWRYDGGRLPTEEEWEAAARGADGRRYPWGNTWDSDRANTQSRGGRRPRPVGSFPSGATPLGVHDLIGNVWEWTSSRMVAYPGGAMPTGGEQHYAIRGGGFNTPDSIADATRRGYLPPSADRVAFAATGFRCVAPLR